MPLHYAAVAGERVRLEVRPREALGTTAARAARREGLIPGVLYGRGREPQPFAVPERALRAALHGPQGRHVILDVDFGADASFASIVKDFQQDPVRGRMVHVDLQEVRLDRTIQAQVDIEIVGEAPGVKQGGILTTAARQVTVEALPMEMPDRIELDVSGADLGTMLRVADLVTPANVTVLDDPETLLAQVAIPRGISVGEAGAEEEGEAEGGAAAAEGGAAEGEAPADESAGE